MTIPKCRFAVKAFSPLGMELTLAEFGAETTLTRAEKFGARKDIFSKLLLGSS